MLEARIGVGHRLAGSAKESWGRLIFIGKGTSIGSFKKEKDEKVPLNLLFNVDDISISEIRHTTVV